MSLNETEIFFEFECDLCQTETCFNCKNDAHKPCQCSDVTDWMKKDTEEAKYLAEQTRMCPDTKCNTRIEKANNPQKRFNRVKLEKILSLERDRIPENLMHCPSCGLRFCFVCEVTLTDHDAATFATVECPGRAD